MKNVRQEIEQGRAKLTQAIEKATAGQFGAADALFQKCREHMLRAERMCDEISGEMKCWIEGVKP